MCRSPVGHSGRRDFQGARGPGARSTLEGVSTAGLGEEPKASPGMEGVGAHSSWLGFVS